MRIVTVDLSVRPLVPCDIKVPLSTDARIEGPNEVARFIERCLAGWRKGAAVLRWLRTLFHPRAPAAASRVIVSDEGIQHVWAGGRIDEVAWSALQVAGVEANAGGPFIEDVYFYLEGPEYG